MRDFHIFDFLLTFSKPSLEKMVQQTAQEKEGNGLGGFVSFPFLFFFHFILPMNTLTLFLCALLVVGAFAESCKV
jgi:hypothetical protein